MPESKSGVPKELEQSKMMFTQQAEQLFSKHAQEDTFFDLDTGEIEALKYMVANYAFLVVSVVQEILVKVAEKYLTLDFYNATTYTAEKAGFMLIGELYCYYKTNHSIPDIIRLEEDVCTLIPLHVEVVVLEVVNNKGYDTQEALHTIEEVLTAAGYK